MVGITTPSCCIYPTRFAIARKTTGVDRANFRLSTTEEVVLSSMTSDLCSVSASSINDVKTCLAASKKYGDLSITSRDEAASTDPGSGGSSTVSGSDISDAGDNSESEGGDDSSFWSTIDDVGLPTGTFCHHHLDRVCDATYSVSHLLQIRETLGRCAPIISYRAQSANGLDADLFDVEGLLAPRISGLSNKTGVADSTEIAVVPPWKRRHRVISEDATDAEVTRILRAILNKLTVERFNVLYEKIADCCMKHPQQLAILAREIFDKAITQHNFIGMYVDLCLRVEKDPRLKPAPGESICKSGSFKRLLLNQCQYSFEELLTMESYDVANKENIDDDDREERRLRRKHRALGNIKLIGQLLVHGMLSSKFLVICCEELLGRRKECTETLEALSTLLTVTGPTFDSRRDWPWRPRLEAVFSAIQDLVSKKCHAEVTPRMRFLLCNLLDLRGAVWIDSKQTTGVKGLAEKQECVLFCQQALGRQDATQRHVVVQPVPSNKVTHVATAVAASELNTTRAAGGSTKDTPQAQVACSFAQPHAQELMTSTKNKTHEQEDSYMNTIVTMGEDKEKAAREFVLQSSPALQMSKRNHKINPLKARDTSNLAINESLVRGLQPFQPKPMVLQSQTFNLRSFRYEITAILKDLASNHDVAGAVHRIRIQQVPPKQQAIEFADMLTRVAEEIRVPARRVAFAFLANLANSENDVFDKTECINGIKLFFDEIYEGLCAEVPRLPAIVSTELVPTLRSAFSVVELGSLIPNDFNT